jgi:hypothetical protein
LISAASTPVASTVIVVSLILQLVGKKIITSMLTFYLTLQLILLIYTKSNIQLPVCVLLLTSTIESVLKLSSFDKKTLTSKLDVPSTFTTEGGLLDSLGGISILAGLVILIAAVVAIAYKFSSHPKIKPLLLKIKLFFFWNFLIRYFQVAYIDLQFNALVQIFSGPTIIGKISSLCIIGVQFFTVCLFTSVILGRPAEYLKQDAIKSMIHNIYLHLDPNHRPKLMYSILFYLQRTAVIGIVLSRASFGV